MSFDLQMSPEFFYAPGEPEDAPPAVNSKGQPISLYSAISSMPAAELAKLATILKTNPDTSDFVSRLVEMAKKTDTATNLGSPTEVWIDPAGDFRVRVYSDDR